MNHEAMCQFVPSYLVEHLSGVDDDELTRCATRTQRIDAALVARRESRPELTGIDADATTAVYTANHTEELPGSLARADGSPPTGDDAVDEAYTGTGQVYGLYSAVFGRDSIDGDGSTVVATVHYGQKYDNAFWDGCQMVFGDGDGVVFGRFTDPPDVLYHEYTHGVIQHTAGLTYSGQPGALNESIADCFAAMTKQRVNGESAQDADWLIGEGLFCPDVNATALRSMKNPGTAYDDPRIGSDRQVGSMSEYVDTTDDNGGVHINSGIPNRAFYLAATGIGGNSWEGAGQIWYAALTGGEVSTQTDFAGFARATLSAARSLYGPDAPELDAVRAAWSEVGVGLRAGAPSNGSPVPPAGSIVVRRTGGVAGVTREETLDLASNPEASELAQMLARMPEAGSQPDQPDRFSYTFVVSGRSITVAEQDLTGELHELVSKVLGS